jgi:hypothetical protein
VEQLQLSGWVPGLCWQEIAARAALSLLALPLSPEYEGRRARGLDMLLATLSSQASAWSAGERAAYLEAARPHMTAAEQVHLCLVVGCLSHIRSAPYGFQQLMIVLLLYVSIADLQCGQVQVRLWEEQESGMLSEMHDAALAHLAEGVRACRVGMVRTADRLLVRLQAAAASAEPEQLVRRCSNVGSDS